MQGTYEKNPNPNSKLKHPSMGKRMRKGVRSSPSPSANIKSIARDIESLGLASSLDADAVASQLRSHFQRSYLRHKLRTLTFSVDKALRFLRTTSNNNNNTPSSVTTSSSSSSDSDDVEGTPARKRPNRTDPSEQRLLRAESQHIRSRARSNPDPPGSSDSDGSTSTSKSEDADFEAKLDPEFDVTSSLLREKYAKLRAVAPAPAPAPAREERNVEIEAAVGRKKGTLGSPEKDAAAVKGDVVVGREGPRFRDLGGMKSVIEELMMEVIVPLCHPQLPRWLGVRPMAGILLHGPPGCGKTKLAHAIANETGVPFYKISATEVVSGVSGASEENIRDLFKKAYRTAPSIVFIDEIDAIASKRENLQREMERRIVTQLMTCMDESHQTLRPEDADSESETSDKKPGYVLVIGATNRPDAVDQALRRPGRFDREIALGVPDENGRLEILSVLTKNLRLEGEFDLLKIARSTPGFVGADLAALANKAGNLAMKRIMDRRKSDISHKLNGEKVEDWWRQPWSPEELDSLSMIMADFEEAIKMVQPSSRREGFSSIPSTKWEDVGGLKSLRKEFDRYIVQRIKNPEDYEELGVNMEVGFLLYGPPGCGKTLIAKAVANEAGANFIHIKGPELLNKYVGESELAVRTIFSRARTCSPCIVFFDEVDALTTKRGKEGGWVVERLLNQLLIELDGADQRQGVYVIGATNRLEVMDPAVLRPGRFGRVLYVPLPSAEERGLILKALSRKKPIAADVDLVALGHKEACRNLTGADLTAVMNEAAMAALEEKQLSWDKDSLHIRPLVIETSHFEKALGKITPSVSEKERNYYEAMSHRYRTAGVEKLELPSTSSMNCDVLCGQVVP